VLNYPGSSSPALVFVSALIECEPNGPSGDDLCTEKYYPGSRCIPDTASPNENATVIGTCSNPFVSGCLRNYLGEETFSRMRVCNSDDDDGAANRGECVEGEFDYREVRILSQDWDSALFSAWIMQILLSELLGVPATIETGKPDESVNFYDPKLGFSYGKQSYDYDALRAALDNDGDCEKFQTERKNQNQPYKACAHVMPEVWNGQKKEMAMYEEGGLIEPTIGTGGVGKLSWYIPYYTAERDPTLLSYFGLAAGNSTTKRRKIAETFLRPITWGYYCDKVTPDNCTSPPYYDEEGRLIAVGAPTDKTESDRYFLPGSFHGHFNATDDNNCDKYPTTCTGHLANVQCEWSTFVASQAHHLGIPVKSNGPQTAGGYSYGDMVDIYTAANYTRNDVLIYWWTPQVKVQEFQGTDAEFQRVLLPTPSEECIESRPSKDKRCSGDTLDHIGGFGACDAEAHTLQKLIVSNLFKISHPIEEAMHSPGYGAITGLKLTDLQLEYMMRKWYQRNIDKWNYDPRHSVCAWAAENIALLKRYVPSSYPRSMEVQEFGRASSYIAMAVALFTLASVGVTFAFTWKNRRAAVFIYAQPNFLFILLFGLALTSFGAILFSIPPSVNSCIARPWFVVLGSSAQMVTLIIKVWAINKVLRESGNMTRTSVRPKKLYGATFAVMGCVAIYLLVWTILDPNTLKTHKELSNHVNEDGGQIVQVTYYCESSTSVWAYISYVYQFLLVVAATVLAFQNQHVDKRFNESFQLALVIYSHFCFIVVNAIFWTLTSLEYITIAIITSFLLSFDVLTSLVFYFLPKVSAVFSPNLQTETSVQRQSGGGGCHLTGIVHHREEERLTEVQKIMRNVERSKEQCKESTQITSQVIDNDILEKRPSSQNEVCPDGGRNNNTHVPEPQPVSNQDGITNVSVIDSPSYKDFKRFLFDSRSNIERQESTEGKC